MTLCACPSNQNKTQLDSENIKKSQQKEATNTQIFNIHLVIFVLLSLLHFLLRIYMMARPILLDKDQKAR